MELAFERVDMPIIWQGPKGLHERGIVAWGSQAGTAVVRVYPDLFRPVEVTTQLEHHMGCWLAYSGVSVDYITAPNVHVHLLVSFRQVWIDQSSVVSLSSVFKKLILSAH